MNCLPKIISDRINESYCEYEVEDIAGMSLDMFDFQESFKVRSPNFSVNNFVNFTMEFSQALFSLHREGYMHLHLSPSNVIWNGKIIQLIDLKFAQQNQPIFKPDRLQGTLEYIAPEQTGRTNRAIDIRTDIYSFGAIMYRLLVGNPPSLSKKPNKIIFSHLAEKIKPMSNDVLGIPENIDNFIMKCLEKPR